MVLSMPLARLCVIGAWSVLLQTLVYLFSSDLSALFLPSGIDHHQPFQSEKDENDSPLDDDEYAPPQDAATTTTDGDDSDSGDSSSSFHVFQIANAHTGSTLLNCILQGLLEDDPLTTNYSFLPVRTPGPNSDRFGPWPENAKEDEATKIDGLDLPFIFHDGVLKTSRENLDATVVTKTHVVDVDYLTETFGAQFDNLYFVAANRESNGQSIDDKYCRYDNVLCIDYDDFAYDQHDEENLNGSVELVKNELEKKFPELVGYSMNGEAAAGRVKRMEKATERMVGLPFSQHEFTFGIHGGHRNRGDKGDKKKEAEGGDDAPGDEEKTDGGAATTSEITPTVSGPDGTAPLNIVHVTSNFRVSDCDARFCPYDQAQSVALASMQRARDHAKKASVTLASAVFPEDADIVPQDFLHLNHLTRSTASEYPKYAKKQLPFLGDVFENLKRSDISAYDYVIYTNSDIALNQDFYDKVAAAVDSGHDAFTINRQTVAKEGQDGRLFTPSDLDTIYGLTGEKHPGSDCFVMKRSIFEQINMGNLFLGFRPTANMLLLQTEKFSNNYRSYESEELKGTYHLGDDRSWAEGKEENLEIETMNFEHAYMDLRKIWATYCKFVLREGTNNYVGNTMSCDRLGKKFTLVAGYDMKAERKLKEKSTERDVKAERKVKEKPKGQKRRQKQKQKQVAKQPQSQHRKAQASAGEVLSIPKDDPLLATPTPGSLSARLSQGDNADNLVPPIPDWMEEYIKFHLSSVMPDKNGGMKLKDGVPYMVYECTGKEKCGGIGDRINSMSLVLYLAMCTGRVLLIDSPYPSPIQNFLNPKDIRWDAKPPVADIPTLDIMDMQNEELAVDASVVGFRLGRCNGLPRRHNLASIWHNKAMTTHFQKINKPYPFPGQLPEETLHRWAFWTMFRFSDAVLSRAEELKQSSDLASPSQGPTQSHEDKKRTPELVTKKSPKDTDIPPYIGVHLRTGDGSMNVGNSGLRAHKDTEQHEKFLQCFHKFQKVLPGTYLGYVASDSSLAKAAINGWDSTVRYTSETQIYHVDKSLRRRKGEILSINDAEREQAYQGSLDAWAELVVVIDSRCIIMSWSMFSFAAHYIGGQNRCGIYVEDCSDENVAKLRHQYVYEIGSPMELVK